MQILAVIWMSGCLDVWMGFPTNLLGTGLGMGGQGKGYNVRIGSPSSFSYYTRLDAKREIDWVRKLDATCATLRSLLPYLLT
ncbi:hypothetical protein F5B19DRAFT_475520 [Rostrohypoxylon terebratum]|nr:hypothetical protein F5B19DRAFT_475520 [Rostrohypoxylon terebratum]